MEPCIDLVGWEDSWLELVELVPSVHFLVESIQGLVRLRSVASGQRNILSAVTMAQDGGDRKDRVNDAKKRDQQADQHIRGALVNGRCLSRSFNLSLKYGDDFGARGWEFSEQTLD